MESEYFHYEWDYKEEKINKFIYSSFLVFNKFKKNKDKNPNKFNFIDYCPKCVKNRISYLMNKPYEYLEGLYISSREEKNPNKKISKQKNFNTQLFQLEKTALETKSFQVFLLV